MDDQGLPTNQLSKQALEISQEIGSSATTVEQAAADPLVRDRTDNHQQAGRQAGRRTDSLW